jgi:type IV pilus assembly protein PilA
MSGFTLIELMVVIVIIGVLASLAIPRFTEATAKAKVAEAPQVLGAYESALRAAIPELSKSEIEKIKGEELIVDKTKDSKWWTYDFAAKGGSAAASGLIYTATANDKMGKVKTGGVLKSTYVPADDAVAKSDCFQHEADGTNITSAIAKAMVPSFMNSGCEAIATTTP